MSDSQHKSNQRHVQCMETELLYLRQRMMRLKAELGTLQDGFSEWRVAHSTTRQGTELARIRAAINELESCATPGIVDDWICIPIAEWNAVMTRLREQRHA